MQDINDQKPVIDTPKNIEIDQNKKKDEVVGKVLVTDKDEENTDNSKITLKILKITPLQGQNPPPDDLFVINDEAKPSKAEFDILTGVALECCYGNFELLLQVK